MTINSVVTSENIVVINTEKINFLIGMIVLSIKEEINLLVRAVRTKSE